VATADRTMAESVADADGEVDDDDDDDTHAVWYHSLCVELDRITVLIQF